MQRKKNSIKAFLVSMGMVKKILKLLLLPFEKILFKKAKSLKIRQLQKTIHIVRSDTIGDFVLFSAILPYFKKIYPGYQIVLIGDAVWQELALWVQKNRVLGGNEKYFDELIAVNGKHYNRNPFYYYKILKRVRLSAPEIVIQPTFSRTEKSDTWVLVSKESQKIGYQGDVSNITAKAKNNNDAQYDRLIKNPESGLESDRNKHFLNALAGYEILASGLPKWHISSSLQNQGKCLLESFGVDASKPILILCPFGSDPKRSWPLEQCALIASKLHAYNSLIQCVIIGGPRDEKGCAKLAALLKKLGVDSYNLCQKTALSERAEMLSVSDVYVGAETGSMHMASAVGIPVVVLRWQGHYERFFPYLAWKSGSENIVILEKRDESDKDIKIKEAFNQAIKFLNRHT